jgi:hypothetical protein
MRVRSRGVLALALLAFAVLPAAAGAKIVLMDAAGNVVGTPVRDDFSHLLRWTDDGAALLIERNEHVLRVGIANRGVTRQPPLDPAVSIGPGGLSIVAAGGYSDARVELHGADGRLIEAWAVTPGRFPPSVAWSPDGARVAIVVPPAVLVVDTASGALLLRDELPETRVSAQGFAPDGSALVVNDGRRVLRIDVASGVASVVFGGSTSSGPTAAWGASGRIAVATGNRIVVLGAAPVSVRLPVSTLDTVFWNRDGSALTYVFILPPVAGCLPSRRGLGMLVPGGAPRVLVAASGADLPAAEWSPDGRTLAVEQGIDYAKQLEHRGRRHPWPRRIARDYGMFSHRGDVAMRRIVLHAARALRRGAGRGKTLGQVAKGFGRVAARFSEAEDSAVEEALANEVSKWLSAAGFAEIDALDEIDC